MLRPTNFFARSHHFVWVTIAIATFTFLAYNLSLHTQIYDIFNGNQVSVAFKILSVLAIYSLFLLLYFILFSYKFILKPTSYFIFLVSSIASYMVDNYGIFFNISMIQNVFQTNATEAMSYFSWRLFFYFIGFGVLPCLVLSKIKIAYPSFRKTLWQRIIIILALGIFTSVVTISYYQQFSFIGRKNRYIYQKIQPYAYIVAVYKTIKETYFETKPEYIYQGLDAKNASTTEKKLVVLVVGETARIQNYAYYGYSRNTNKYTEPFNLINFKNVQSCGTATAISVPCMFTNLTHDNFSSLLADHRDNVFDIVQKAGLYVTWLENDGGCKGMCTRINTIDIPTVDENCTGSFCDDSILLKHTKAEIKKAYESDKDSLIIVHVNGSHGPRYYERYPKDFAQFLPECRRADVENCKLDELINTYDNTILYTDYIISKIIEDLKPYENNRATALFYISDHGESLGEDGVFLHGLPYALAPKYQTQVPLQMYFGKNTLAEMKVNEKCLRNETNGNYSQDHVFHTLLSILQIKTEEYQSDLDMLKNCRQ